MFVKDSFFFGLQLEADVGPSAGSSQTSSEELSETTATPLSKSVPVLPHISIIITYTLKHITYTYYILHIIRILHIHITYTTHF